MEIRDRVVIVTGAGSGLGRVIAVELADRGAHVVIADADPDAAADVGTEISADGGRAAAVGVEVTRASDREAPLELAAGLGGVQVLVNNAGGWGRAERRFPDATQDEWDAVLDLNLRAPIALTQQCLDSMKPGRGADRSPAHRQDRHLVDRRRRPQRSRRHP